MSYKYDFFTAAEIGSLYKAFVASFSDYYLNFQPNVSQFYHRIFHKLNINNEVSGLVSDEEEVIGFIMHTINDYEGQRVAYNGGSGIIPGKRKQGVMTRLYEMLMPRIRDAGVHSILLEVITDNKPAVGFYRSLGFEYTRVFKCFKSYEKYDPKPIEGLQIKRSFVLKKEYESIWDFTPSFLDNTPQLAHNMNNEIILEAWVNEEFAGYIIFQPAVGRISQISVAPDFRGNGVGIILLQAAQALSRKKNITLMNIPEDEEETLSRLEAIGFKNEVTQYEMELVI